ncbi:hypothetical protein GH714_042838 [Hevea brasiliensis]|uniref:Uncharacterized protein n=1 Tax=Hevea brasiliensis TaxID=3981 RepID=A0A6A6K0K1_HEVBR|nr:hypothetical protein GH714_042838 [Hevea brasiliensis]
MCVVRRVFLTGVLCTVFCGQECIASSSSSGALDLLLGEVSKRAETMVPSVESGIGGVMTWRKSGDDKSGEKRSQKEVSVDGAQKQDKGEKKPPAQGGEPAGDVAAATNTERVQNGNRDESVVRHGAIDTVRYLLSNGADVGVKNDKGETPLSVAIDKGRVDVINAISEMQVGFSEEEQEG